MSAASHRAPAASVRRATVADLPQLAELFALYREFYAQPFDEDASGEFLRQRLERDESVVLIAEAAGGAALGFVQSYPTFGSVELGPAWRLNDLFVRPSMRGSGVGEMLMHAAEAAAAASGAAWIDLETARDNATAQRLYERQGYVRDDTFLHYVKKL